MERNDRINIIRRLKEADNLRVGRYADREVYLHDEHRWAAALILLAQLEGKLPRPANLVVIDRHHDAIQPGRECLRAIREVRSGGLRLEDVLNLIEHDFSEHDDDWIVGAMELGLIGDAAVIGSVGLFERQALLDFEDHTGGQHHIELAGTIGPELAPHGRLGDHRGGDDQARLWEILGWRHEPGAGFSFDPEAPRLALSIDLDAFVIPWESFRIPWPEEVFAAWFPEAAAAADAGVPGRSFMRQLLSRAGMAAVAKEAGHCGGEANAAVILERLRRYLFDGALELM